MNPSILKPEVQQYLFENEQEDLRKMGLKKSPFTAIEPSEIAQQLKGRMVAKLKFPSLYQTPNIYYPPSVNLEQASSEATAHYKASLISGKRMIDLTAGFGIDSFAFAKNFQEVTHIEQNESLSRIVAHNAEQLHLKVACFSGTFSTYFEQNPNEQFDLIYLDPARRDQKGRKFMLEDLEPNILEWMDLFFEKAPRVMIKLSPLLDITSVIMQLPTLSAIHLVAVKNELKDFLIVVEKESTNAYPIITASNLLTDQSPFVFQYGAEEDARALHSGYDTYLYDPNVAILKTGAFKLLAERYGLKKLHPNTHLYTSKERITTFPGRVYEVLEEITHPKKQILKSKTNVLVKNFPQAIDILKKKYQLKDGGPQTLIFTQSIEGMHILKTQKL